MRSLPAFALMLLAALAIRPAFGGDAIDWSFKAFGTLGAVGTDTDQLGFRRDYTQDTAATRDWSVAIDSRLGLQIDADYGNTLHAAVQFVARNHAGAFVEQNLEWAYLRWRPRDDLDLRIGRLGLDVFLLSDYRNVGYAFPWIRPPEEFYFPLFPYHFDGADIAQRFGLGEGFLTVKGFAGYNLTDVLPSYSPVFGLETLMFGGSLAFESGDWRTRLGYAQLRALNDTLQVPTLRTLFNTLQNPLINALWPGAAALGNDFSIQGRQIQYTSVGLAYDDGLWPIQAEAAYIHSEANQLPGMANAYLSVGRRFGAVTLYSLFGIAESLHAHADVPEPLVPAPDLVSLRNYVDGLLNGNHMDQKSLSVGLRYDVYENIAVKAQWGHFWLGNGSTLFWLDPTVSSPGAIEVNVWSFGVDFVF
jgi:hypothetical protein